jgi:hypothetical protein
VTRAKPVTWALDRVDNRAGFQNSERKSYSSCLRERERERKNKENSGSFMKIFSKDTFDIKKTSL